MMNQGKFKVVITDCDHGSIKEEREELRKIQAEPILAQVKEEKEIIWVCHDAHALINQYSLITRKVMQSLDKCQVISRYGVGVDSIDLEAATEQGIMVVNVPDYCFEEASTHAVALLLSWCRKIAFFNAAIKKGNWDYQAGIPLERLKGKTLGIVGLGRIGREVARKLSGFKLKILAYDPYLRQAPKGIKLVTFKELLANSDFISIHSPLTRETRHLFGEEQFQAMKKSAILINTARGAIVEEKALYKALSKGWIRGAALDVMEKEPPPPDYPLLKLENIILTPHISWYSEDSRAELKRKTAGEVVRVLQGKMPTSLVNEEVLERASIRFKLR